MGERILIAVSCPQNRVSSDREFHGVEEMKMFSGSRERVSLQPFIVVQRCG
jgi:hypothetical protein